MQDLRDKLLKAGLANKQQAREARTEKRRQRKKKGKARADSQEEQERQRRFEEKQASEAEASRERQAELNRKRAEQERVHRIRDLVRAHAVLKPLGDERRFYFVARNGRIRRLVTTHELGTRLSDGRLAIVDLPDDPRRDFALVDERTAARLEELGAEDWIRFWNKPGADSGDLPAYGAC